MKPSALTLFVEVLSLLGVVACSAGTSSNGASTRELPRGDPAATEKPPGGPAPSVTSAPPSHSAAGGPSAGGCATDADCRLVHDCHCACVAADLASATQIDCADTPCARDDCAGKKAVCAGGRCEIR